MSRAEAARTILGIPLFDEVMRELEQSAIDQAVTASPTNHDLRQAHLCMVKAIRDLRSQLEVFSKEDQSKSVKKAPA